MPPRLRLLLPAFATLIFAIVALVFSALAISSSHWAVRDNYDIGLPPEAWHTPVFTLHRAPFAICAVEAVINKAGVAVVPTSAPYSTHCTHYRPFGRDRTSCESANATGDEYAVNAGDSRLCQQIHYAGNFGISSTAFLGLGLVNTIVLVLTTFARLNARYSSDAGAPSVQRRHKTGSTEGARAVRVSAEHSGRQARNHTLARYINLALVSSLGVGVITGIISQTYGVLGLIQSQPNQADFSSSAGQGASNEVGAHGNHGPWRQGVALSVYATCAWSFGLAAAALASLTWRLPRWYIDS